MPPPRRAKKTFKVIAYKNGKVAKTSRLTVPLTLRYATASASSSASSSSKSSSATLTFSNERSAHAQVSGFTQNNKMAAKSCCTCKIGPSILNADLSCLADECNRLLECGADYLHLDVMDGHFVPNLTFGAPLVKCLRKKVPNAFFDMHMMVANPEKWVDDMADAGADQYTFHLEATDKPVDLINQIKKAGMKVGIGIKPNTPVDTVLPFVELVDMVLIMTVEPGFGGQKFMADMMPKVKHLRTKYRVLDIEVDGGVGISTIEAAAQAGANMIVSGSAVIKTDKPKEVIDSLRATTEKWIKINSEASQ